MISKKYRSEELMGRKCCPVRKIRNRAGNGITPNTICTIVGVVRGRGITIETPECPHCGQSTRITGISRNELELILEEAILS